MAEVVAVANQKGGVAKTTTVHTLGVALAELGVRVLLVDLDPQACLTYATGLDPERLPVTLHDVLAGRHKTAEAIVARPLVSVLPAAIDLAGSEVALVNSVGREHAVARALSTVTDAYDVILIDCPPSLGILTINGLTAARHVLIPVQCETLSHRGVGQLLETVADVRAYTQPDLTPLGAVATMYDGRTRHGREVLTDLTERYGLRVLRPHVPRSVRFAEAPAAGRSVIEHAPRSLGAQAYRELARLLLPDLGLSASDAPGRPGAPAPRHTDR